MTEQQAIEALVDEWQRARAGLRDAEAAGLPSHPPEYIDGVIGGLNLALREVRIAMVERVRREQENCSHEWQVDPQGGPLRVERCSRCGLLNAFGSDEPRAY